MIRFQDPHSAVVPDSVANIGTVEEEEFLDLIEVVEVEVVEEEDSMVQEVHMEEDIHMVEEVHMVDSTIERRR